MESILRKSQNFYEKLYILLPEHQPISPPLSLSISMQEALGWCLGSRIYCFYKHFVFPELVPLCLGPWDMLFPSELPISHTFVICLSLNILYICWCINLWVCIHSKYYLKKCFVFSVKHVAVLGMGYVESLCHIWTICMLVLSFDLSFFIYPS